MGQKTVLNERSWDSPISIPKHDTDDLNMSPATEDKKDRENRPLKRSLESSSEALEGTPESHGGDVSQDPVTPSVQRRKLAAVPPKDRYLRKVARIKRRRKRKSKEKVELHYPTILPTPLAPPQSEEDKAVDPKPTRLSAQEDDRDLPSEVRMRHGVAKFWACHTSTGKIMVTLHFQ